MILVLKFFYKELMEIVKRENTSVGCKRCLRMMLVFTLYKSSVELCSTLASSML